RLYPRGCRISLIEIIELDLDAGYTLRHGKQGARRGEADIGLSTVRPAGADLVDAGNHESLVDAGVRLQPDSLPKAKIHVIGQALADQDYANAELDGALDEIVLQVADRRDLVGLQAGDADLRRLRPSTEEATSCDLLGYRRHPGQAL